jgi:hypothetical protein
LSPGFQLRPLQLSHTGERVEIFTATLERRICSRCDDHGKSHPNAASNKRFEFFPQRQRIELTNTPKIRPIGTEGRHDADSSDRCSPKTVGVLELFEAQQWHHRYSGNLRQRAYELIEILSQSRKVEDDLGRHRPIELCIDRPPHGLGGSSTLDLENDADRYGCLDRRHGSESQYRSLSRKIHAPEANHDLVHPGRPHPLRGCGVEAILSEPHRHPTWRRRHLLK